MRIEQLLLIAPALLLVTALLQIAPGPGRRLSWLAEAAAAATLLIVLGAAFRLGLRGPSTVQWLGSASLGLSIRLDVLSISMMLLVCFIAWVVVRFTAVYLDGEPRKDRFIAWLCCTLAAVQCLVLAGNLEQLVLAWIATSLFLHQLLLFYPDRVAARRAARKKFISARLSEAALVGAALLLFVGFGSSDIATILAGAHANQGGAPAMLAAMLLAVAALLKSAQFPMHGWLTEVMEAPTPVSALLHAGIVNAGGFLLIRFADLMVQCPIVLAVLVLIGGFTALFGSMVMLTQSAVKTSLAWSTVAQMGFMMLECGLGLFPLALLHILAHSLYKAHAFLASGGAVELIAAGRRPGPVAIPNPRAIARAFVLALAIYAIAGFGFGVQHKSPQSIALGAILIFGVAYMLAQGLADTAPRALTWRTTLYALATSFGYFALQRVALSLTADLLPAAPAPGPLEWALILLAVGSFGLAAVAQAMFPLWAYHPAAAGLRVHLSNGFYVNALLDRLLGSWSWPHEAAPAQRRISDAN